MIALIVSHGQPSDPDPAEAELAELAGKVARLLPGWDMRSATLAKPGALAAAVKGGPGLVHPMFMAGGWFTEVQLPKKLAEAGAEDWQVLAPFGENDAVQRLCVTLATEAVADIAQASVLLAAHGSGRSAAPAEVAIAMAARLRTAGFARAEAYFIEHPPMIATARGFGPNAICLPFFAAAGGHVVRDLPKALAEAGFMGRVLPALGLDLRVPELIAKTLQSHSIGD